MPWNIETNIRHLPIAYQCAIERMSGFPASERTVARLVELCDAYAQTYGIRVSDEHDYFVRSAVAIAKDRFQSKNYAPRSAT